MTVLAEIWLTDWLTDWLTETTYQLLDHIWITLTSYYYQLRMLVTIIWETDRVTSTLTDQHLYKVTDWLFNWPAKEARNWEMFQPINCLTGFLIGPTSGKRSTDWLNNWRWDQLNDWKVYEIQANYITSKSVIWPKKNSIFVNWFQVSIFHWLSLSITHKLGI